jgi:hypothetical protein
MVVLRGESRYRQDYKGRIRKNPALSFLCFGRIMKMIFFRDIDIDYWILHKMRQIYGIIVVKLLCIFLSGCGGVIDVRSDIDKCPVHGTLLQEDTVGIRYGFPVLNEEYMKAERELFPYVNNSYLGGCIVKPEKRALVRYCTECRQAEKEWKKPHSRQVLK